MVASGTRSDPLEASPAGRSIDVRWAGRGPAYQSRADGWYDGHAADRASAQAKTSLAVRFVFLPNVKQVSTVFWLYRLARPREAGFHLGLFAGRAPVICHVGVVETVVSAYNP
jgi:hypothetical protein